MNKFMTYNVKLHLEKEVEAKDEDEAIEKFFTEMEEEDGLIITNQPYMEKVTATLIKQDEIDTKHHAEYCTGIHAPGNYLCIDEIKWLEEKRKLEKILKDHREIICALCEKTMGYISSVFNYAGVDIICNGCKERIETKCCK